MLTHARTYTQQYIQHETAKYQDELLFLERIFFNHTFIKKCNKTTTTTLYY